MVHVKKCPSVYGRSRKYTDFYINGEPQDYCVGWWNKDVREPLEVCRNCKDFIEGEQHDIDVELANKRQTEREGE